ncbi:valine--tRNA ligase [Polymorphum gilvum]|uniref:Valine--tRNA ligase n=1 Tax=Polymorphum gilvum (strain LMG 25793 / CGMCC 1.9160 / SL003B-26A1) TaxID=991905 RepID=F2IXE8_POLGS|nr:valine--tRNA ligase [Polymorphum gilvum]ADZ70466.1 Valyl-tRNA synthetase [Polymorphum gilvum SL003B-26A1]
MLEKTYDAASVEPRIYDTWEKAEAFSAGAGAGAGSPSYTIVIPPPNVTGSLHMGHALNNTLQDVLVRFERMRGKDVLWQPGMDHAGIATQMVVERQLMERQEPGRRDMGRDAFVQRVWEWKAESGGMILNQLKRLGASCDWSRERFTMDEGLSAAVLEVFVSLYRDGLIYKDKRLVNWDPKLLTAISDLEVQQVELKGNLWHFRYPLEDGLTYRHPVAFDEDGTPTEFEIRDYIVVATTRPETMLGDTAVAVNPEDPRYRDLIGRHVILPLVGRRIPIVGDDYADPTAGSGAVKITPAHDFNDFEVGKRHDLPMISVLDREARVILKDNAEFLAGVAKGAMLDETIAAFDGLDRFAARKRLVERMEAAGCLDRIEDHVHMVPHGDRGGVPIEPLLTDQWYVDAATLAKPAIASVREGRTSFVPKNWEKTYFEWMENIQPWCISRQLWWGHQIPAWYGPDGHLFVEKDEATALAAAQAHYGTPVRVVAMEQALAAWEKGTATTETLLYRDEDVLDTWFSSALWPFSTLGWPDKTPELARYFPTSVLITGFDIIFFWVARMMMMSLHFMKTEPFETVYIHALVRDEKGQKMSKSKGNVIDPLSLVEEFGADALRFTLTAMAAQGRDIKLATSRVGGYRNFATKLWNAARFAEMNGCRRVAGFDPNGVTHTLNRWIATETGRCAEEVTAALESYRFNDAANVVYRFVWNTYCDWFLELAKPVFNGSDEAVKAETRATAAWALDEILKILHPFMPFLTEELWARLGDGAELPGGRLLMLTPWPTATMADAASADEINWLVELISEIRSVRAEMNVPAGAQVPIVIVGAGETTLSRIRTHEAAILRLARADSIALADVLPKGAAQIIIGDATVCLPLEGVIDLDAERARLEKELDKLDGEIVRIEKKLSNPSFVERAPEEVVEGEREKLAEFAARKEQMRAALQRLSAAA